MKTDRIARIAAIVFGLLALVQIAQNNPIAAGILVMFSAPIAVLVADHHYPGLAVATVQIMAGAALVMLATAVAETLVLSHAGLTNAQPASAPLAILILMLAELAIPVAIPPIVDASRDRLARSRA